MTETLTAGIYGISGYTGMEMLKLLDSHPCFSIEVAQSRQFDGKKVKALTPLPVACGEVEISSSPAEVPDVAFLCLPAGDSMKLTPSLVERGAKVVDLSPDYRLHPAGVYEKIYGIKHTDPEGLDAAVYGLSEVMASEIASARIVANPGCYPTAALLALFPLAEKIEGPVIIDAKSGTSGSGKEPTAFNHHAEVAENVKQYSVGKHRHIPEIERQLRGAGLTSEIMFVPHLVPLVRGLMTSIYLPSMDASEALTTLRSYYGGSHFVHVVEEASLKAVTGTNHCLLQISAVGGGCVIFSCIDNLLKGASGQAVQNANLMSGLPEETGLLRPSVGTGI
ncbi:MAG: N-acetyl-gamma-glutamyl-phosphate reductase [Methanomassiliicoccales archaeon]